jgi:hypothetical protein
MALLGFALLVETHDRHYERLDDRFIHDLSPLGGRVVAPN